MQKQVRKPEREATVEDDAAPPGSPDQAKKGDDLKSAMDELLDEIDEVLEQNAEAFVKAYQQKGGQ